MRILLIDDDDEVQALLQVLLEKELSDVRITSYDCRRLGRPGPDFDWGAFDLLVLDYDLGLAENGVDWLRDFGSLDGFPPTLLLTGTDRPRVVGEAVGSGASGYLNKSNLDAAVLADTVRKIVSQRAADDFDDGEVPTFQGRAALETGRHSSSYRFTRLIGRGGMSRVYLASRIEDGMTVVLKLLNRDLAKDPENALRFAREGELISRVNSPYVVTIYDHGVTNSYGYIAMEFFGRGDLAQQIERGISPEDAVLYLHNIACGLEAVHRMGIVHRDLTPGNIMFRGDGSMALVDFGLSKRVGADLSLTETGSIMGTPYAMSPEQTSGRVADRRSDIYSAGVMFFQMLTGNRPFYGASLPALLLAIQRDPAPALSGELVRFQPLMTRLLAKNPDHRYQSAGELIDALAPFFDHDQA